MYYSVWNLKSNRNTSFKLPKKPKSKLEDLRRQEKQKSVKLEGENLQQYLESLLVKECEIVNTDYHISDLSILEDNLCIEEMKQHLISGYKFVTQEQCKLFRVYLDYGEWLDAAFDLFKKSSIDEMV